MSTSNMFSTGLEGNKKTLFKTAMKGDWREVVNIYKKHPEIQKAKITKSGDTALHIAVSDGQERIVEQLVELMETSNTALEPLKIQNERGNTPLHLAAALGNIRMCKCIATIDPELIGCRNNDNETPFFLAALHGRKDAFLSLHSICGSEKGYTFCRRNDGETILHCTIAGEYFDLAFQIIDLYNKLANYVNEQGFSPLHVLASKPSAFRSGSHIRRFDKIIYHCIFVDDLVPHSFSEQPPLSQELEYREEIAMYPLNYQSCINFAVLVKKVFCLLVLGSGKNNPGQPPDVKNPKGKQIQGSQQGLGSGKNNRGQPPDVENPNGKQIQGSKKGTDLWFRILSEGHQGKGGHHLFPANYNTCFEAIKFVSKAMLIVFGLGSRHIEKIQQRKERHVWSVQVLDKLLELTSLYEYEDNGRSPHQLTSFKDDVTSPYAIADGGDVTFSDSGIASLPKVDRSDESSPRDRNGEKNVKNNGNGVKGGTSEMAKRETPVLIAAKNGVVEMVDKIFQLFPVAIHDMNSDKKNIVLLAVENRQPHVYQLLMNMKIMKDSIFRKVDKEGNSALHLAAKLGEHKPWLIPGAALQMQWEIKWYEYVKNSMPLHFFVKFNKDGKTPKDIFTETHQKLVESGGKWLADTSESCSVVAALIATVAFATSATVPGGVKQDVGTPTLENQPAFDVFAISSLVALCFSVTAVVMFLAILTSRNQEKDFGTSLPNKLLLGLSSLFVSIASMLLSFSAGHFFVLKDKLKYAAFPVYAVTCLPVTFFAVAQFPLYFDLIWATFRKIPQRSYKVIAP